MAKKRVHRVPHEAVRAVLVAHGVDTVNRAVEWGATKSINFPLISPKSVEGIIRGRRTLGVEFERVDQIVCALDAPESWYTVLYEWYHPPGFVPEPEYETFLSHGRAIDVARAMFAGEDAALSFG